MRAGLVIYALVAVVLYLVPSPIGGNLARPASLLAGPLAAIVLRYRRRVLALVVVPLLVWEFGPMPTSAIGQQQRPVRVLGLTTRACSAFWRLTPRRTAGSRSPSPAATGRPDSWPRWRRSPAAGSDSSTSATTRFCTAPTCRVRTTARGSLSLRGALRGAAGRAAGRLGGAGSRPASRRAPVPDPGSAPTPTGRCGRRTPR